MPLVKAIAEGFDGRQVRKPGGEPFEWDGPIGSWMEIVGVSVEQVIEATKRLQDSAAEDQKTPTGLIKKSVLEQHLGAEVSQGTFLEAMKQIKAGAAT